MAATLICGCGKADWRREAAICERKREVARNIAGNERPVRGDNRTGQAIWALGVDGRSRLIHPRWGGITAPTHSSRSRGATRSNPPAIFLRFWPGIFRRKLLRGGANGIAGGRFAGRHLGGGLIQGPA